MKKPGRRRFCYAVRNQSPVGWGCRALSTRTYDRVAATFPGVDRIESQLLLRPHGTHAETLRNAGFHIYERLFMELDLRSASLLEGPPDGALDELELRAWRDSDFAAAGHLIAHAYEGHLDGIIKRSIRSVSGSLRFLHNIVRFPGCGLFDASASRVLAYRNREEIAALLLCSRVREDVGHVTQICVSRQYRRRGLGAWLLARLLARRCADPAFRRSRLLSRGKIPRPLHSISVADSSPTRPLTPWFGPPHESPDLTGTSPEPPLLVYS